MVDGAPKLSPDANQARGRGNAQDPPALEPLKGYKRLTKTTAQILGACELDGAALLTSARQKDESVDGHLSAEALVYFIRRSLRDNDLTIRDYLFKELFERCQPFFRGQFRGFDRHTREDLQSEVMRALVEDLFAPDSRGDFMQVRFWVYLKRRTIDACREHFKHSDVTESLDTGLLGTGKSDGRTLLDRKPDQQLSPEELVSLRTEIAQLSPKLREVFMLRHYVGLKIGPDDPDEVAKSELTLARHYNRPGRTIRNWLKEASMQLERFREKTDGK